MTILQQAITILMCTAATMLTRFLPFVVFHGTKPIPQKVTYLGNALPSAIFAMLVVYCFRNVDVTTAPFGAAEWIACAITILIHIYKRNTLLSMFVGTVSYMLLIQFVF